MKKNLQKLKRIKNWRASTPTSGRFGSRLNLLLILVVLFTATVFNKAQAQCSNATYNTAANNCGIDYISNVTFATINRTSVCDVLAVYTTPNPLLIMGNTYTLSVSTGGDTEGVRAWIDYNQDGTYNNAVGTELVMGPMYAGTNPATYTIVVTIPLTATPGVTRLRVRCNYASAPADATSAQTWGETEDYCVTLVPAVPCAGAPASNTVLPANFSTCPGFSNPGLTLANPYLFNGISYQWYSSTTSAVGIYSPINNATLSAAPVPTLGVTTWYQLVATCNNPGGGSTTLTPVQYSVPTGAVVNTVPYHEDFEGVQLANRLPNCSWFASNLGTSVTTYMGAESNNRVARSGSKFAAFGLPSNNNYVYTNEITMNPGITYSASLWYATEYLGASNWTSLSILVGPNQSTTGLVQVATISPAVSGSYKELTGLFTVPSAGNYYVAIKATAASGSALYLSWDDLSVTIPCTGGGVVNSPTVSIAVADQTICLGESINLSASGADTYTWSTGANTSGITENPVTIGITNYTVTGENLTTGCKETVLQTIYVDPSPIVLVSAFPATVCVGQPVTLSAAGNSNSYMWSNGMSGAAITVTLASPSTFTAIGTGINGCTSQSSKAVGTLNLPTIVPSSNNADPCTTDQITLTASGGVSYQWISNTSPNVLQGASVNVILSNGPTVFTVTGTGLNGCSSKGFLSQNANTCVGINKQATSKAIQVYPNPASQAITVEFNSTVFKTIEVIDLMGRIVLSTSNADEKTEVSIRGLANGLYYVKIKANTTVDVIRIIKQ